MCEYLLETVFVVPCVSIVHHLHRCGDTRVIGISKSLLVGPDGPALRIITFKARIDYGTALVEVRCLLQIAYLRLSVKGDFTAIVTLDAGYDAQQRALS